MSRNSRKITVPKLWESIWGAAAGNLLITSRSVVQSKRSAKTRWYVIVQLRAAQERSDIRMRVYDCKENEFELLSNYCTRFLKCTLISIFIPMVWNYSTAKHLVAPTRCVLYMFGKYKTTRAVAKSRVSVETERVNLQQVLVKDIITVLGETAPGGLAARQVFVACINANLDTD